MYVPLKLILLIQSCRKEERWRREGGRREEGGGRKGIEVGSSSNSNSGSGSEWEVVVVMAVVKGERKGSRCFNKFADCNKRLKRNNNIKAVAGIYLSSGCTVGLVGRIRGLVWVALLPIWINNNQSS